MTEVPAMLSRRKFLFGAAAATLLTSVDVFAIEPSWLDVRQVRWPVEGLPASAEGLRVVQVTDAHLRSLTGQEDRLVQAIKAADCQLVVLTGDLVDHAEAVPVLREYVAAIRAVVPRVLAIPGNWEHWSGCPFSDVAEAYQSAGAELLRNQSRLVEGIRFVGGDDDLAGFADHARNARDGVGEHPRVYLCHEPGIFSKKPLGAKFAAIFSGHTHGGQAQIFGFAPFLPPGSGPYRAGYYDTAWGPLYVSRGVGTTAVPGRMLCRPELPVFTFVRA